MTSFESLCPNEGAQRQQKKEFNSILNIFVVTFTFKIVDLALLNVGIQTVIVSLIT